MKKTANRQKADFPRDRRLKLIRELFGRWGRMNQQQLYERLSAKLSEDISTLKRTLYRDIEYLVLEGELVEHCTTRDGVPIEDFDPEIHKSVYKEFSVPDYEGNISGGCLIEKVGGKFFASASLTKEIKIEEGGVAERPGQLNVYYSAMNMILRMRIPLDQLPLTLLVARIPDIGTIQPKFEELEKRFGRRIAFLQLPINTLSAQRDLDRPGHTTITIKAHGKAVVTDLNSKNGTFCSEVDKTYAERLTKGAISFSDTTATSNWASRGAKVDWLQIPGGKSEEFSAPLILRLSQDFMMLVCQSAKK